MKTDNDSVRAKFEQWWDEADDIPNDGPWAHDTPIQFSWAAWQASRERYVPKPAKDAGYGCHCDLEPHMKPDGCVIDMGALRNCVYAEKLIDAGKSRDDCEYWQPIVVATPNGGNES